MVKFASGRQLGFYRKYADSVKYVMMAISVILITVALPKQARFRFEYETGKIWMHKDLISPYNFAIKKTDREVAIDKAGIVKSVLPIYQSDTALVSRSLQVFAADFENKWNAAGLPPESKQIYLNKGLNLLKAVYSRGVYQPVAKFQRFGTHYNFSLLNRNVSKQLNTANTFTLDQAIDFIANNLANDASIPSKEWLQKMIEDRIQANYVYDQRLTDALEADALSNVSTTRGMVQKGELIVANGAIVTDEIFQKLESLRAAYQEDASQVGDKRLIFFGQFLLVGLVISLMVVFLYLFRRDIFHDNRQMSIIMIIVTGMLLALSWALRSNIPSLYYIPYCVVPIIIRILFDTRLALNIHLMVLLIAGFFVPNSFEFAFLQITAGMTAIYSIKNLVKREQFLISALFILANYCVAYMGISLIRDGSLRDIDWRGFQPFIFSVLLTLLAYPLIYAFEKLFGITSDVTLMELTNTNSRLLRDLSYKAPGTFQHSLQVANLAEAAIFKIGGNALLVRAGALYHDIGKMDNPQYFIENQVKGYNPHDSLSYEESARIIIQHVSKGVELARRNQIPEMVVDFIRTHHGNTRVDYFYQSFLKNFPEKFVDENIFRYPGPIPFSKETAVLMLADSVEAASRSLKEPDAQSISDLVERIIDYKLEQDQLNDSDITLKDIETIKLIFKTMLMGIYHVRIDYVIEN